MMMKLLELRELGVDSNVCLQKYEISRRTHSIDLDKNREFERVHTAGINSLDLDPVECRHLLSGGGDGAIAIHDLQQTTSTNLRCKKTFPIVCCVDRNNRYRHKYSVDTVQWYPLDTGMFVSSGMDNTVKVWDTNTMLVANEFQLSACVYSHHMSSIATKHCLIAVGLRTDQVQLIDLKSGSRTHSLKGHSKSVLVVRWSPRDEFLLATAGRDSKLLFWDIRRAKGSLMVLDQHNGDTSASPQSVNTAHSGHVNGVKFLPDGLHLLSVGTDDNLRLWETLTGRNTLINYGRIDNNSNKDVKLGVSQDATPSIAYVPSGNDVVVCDIMSGMRLNTLRGHYSQVNSCIVNNDNQELYTAANDRSILVWSPSVVDQTLSDFESNKPRTSFVQRIGGHTDTWSSDED